MRPKSNDPVRIESRSAPAIAAAVAAILYGASGATYAADQAATAGSENNALEEIVVTASAQGVKKLDASYNVVSASLEEIQNANPASAAEIFKLSPGIWPEASGGQTGSISMWRASPTVAATHPTFRP